MARLGDYVKIRTGKLDANASSPDGEYPFFTCAVEPLRISTYSYDCECVLVAGNGDLNVKYYNGKFDAYQRTYIIESLNKCILDTVYLYKFLDKYVETLRKDSIGGVIKYIKLGNLTEADIPLPDLPTQRRIAATLDKVSEGIAVCRQMLADLDLLVKSQFVEVIEPLLQAKETIPLDQLVEDDRPITYGILKPGTGFPNGVPVVKVKDMKNGEIDQSDLLLTSPEIDNQYKRSRLRTGDLLISIRGSVGRMAEVPENLENANITQDTARLTIKPAYNRVYIRAVLESHPMQLDMEKNIRGVAVKGINIGYLRELGIPMCDREKQDKLAELYQQADKSKFVVQQQLAELETLKKSLMQEYFG